MPLKTADQYEQLLLRTTLCDRDCKKDEIHCVMSECYMILILGEAFGEGPPVSKFSVHLSIMLSSCVTVDLPFINPYYLLLK